MGPDCLPGDLHETQLNPNLITLIPNININSKSRTSRKFFAVKNRG